MARKEHVQIAYSGKPDPVEVCKAARDGIIWESKAVEFDITFDDAAAFPNNDFGSLSQVHHSGPIGDVEPNVYKYHVRRAKIPVLIPAVLAKEAAAAAARAALEAEQAADAAAAAMKAMTAAASTASVVGEAAETEQPPTEAAISLSAAAVESGTLAESAGIRFDPPPPADDGEVIIYP